MAANDTGMQATHKSTASSSSYAGLDDSSDRLVPSQAKEVALPTSAKHNHTLWIFFIACCLAPVVLLAAFTRRLSTQLGRSGCMPSGDFVLPYKSSIWDASQFFVPTLSFNVGSSGQNHSGLTIARLIDLTWDLAVARGGQALLAWLAYRVFRRVLRAQMKAGEVGYDVYGEVTMHTGQFRSLMALWRRTHGKIPLPCTRGARRVHWAMAGVTVYVLAVPTLFSALTGYVSVTTPSVLTKESDYDTQDLSLNYTRGLEDTTGEEFQDCDGPLLLAFGVLEHTCFHYDFPLRRDDLCENLFSTSFTRWRLPDFLPMPYPWHPHTCREPDYWDYYQRYVSFYAQCDSRVGSETYGWAPAANCTSLDRESYIKLQCQSGAEAKLQLQAPLLNMTIYPAREEERKRHPFQSFDRRYTCAGRTIRQSWLWKGRDKSVCKASANYAWGFSFHLVIVAGLLSAATAATLYALWLYALRLAPGKSDTNAFLDAAFMISTAQQQFGTNVHEWMAKKVEEVILKGGQGIGDPPAYLRLRHLR